MLTSADSELREYQEIRGIVVVHELTDTATVRVDGCPLDIDCALEHLEPEREAA